MVLNLFNDKYNKPSHVDPENPSLQMHLKVSYKSMHFPSFKQGFLRQALRNSKIKGIKMKEIGHCTNSSVLLNYS